MNIILENLGKFFSILKIQPQALASLDFEIFRIFGPPK